jgi:hypothetical protein
MRLLILFLFLSGSFQVMAQSRHFVETIGWKDKTIEVQTISNRTRQSSCTFVVSSDSIRAFVFTGQQLKLMRQFSLPRKGHERLLGGFMRDSSLYMYTKLAEKGALHCTAINVVTEEIKETFVRLDLSRERTVAYINAGNHFVYLTANYRTRELSVFNFTSDRPGVGMRYQLSEPFWRDLTLGSWGHNIAVEVMEREGEPDLQALVRNNKLYVKNDTMLLVMNNHIDSTFVVSFDLKQHSADSWLIEHNPGKRAAKNVPFSDNSFVFRNKLYYVRATTDSLLVQVADLYTGEINKTFSSERKEDITYKNTPFMLERTVDDKRKDPKDLSKTSSLLRNMVDGQAVIMARPFGNDQVEVLVGSYEKSSSTTAVGGYYGYNIPRPYGYNATVVPYDAYNQRRIIRTTWTNSVYFKMLLNGADFSHVEGEPGSSPNERIDRYTYKMKIDPEAESLFVNNGQHYYAYYDKAGYKLVVLKF